MRSCMIVVALLGVARMSAAQPPNFDLERADRLELALTHAATRFDAVSYLSAQRSMLVAIFEGVCAFGFLVPPSEDRVEVGLGVGCLVGAATLTYMAYRNFARPRAVLNARERLARFQDAREDSFRGASLSAFEEDLEHGSRRGRRRRRFAGAFGVLNLIATVVLSVLVGTNDIDRNPGVAVASGTAVVGILGVAALFVQSPDEHAWRLY